MFAVGLERTERIWFWFIITFNDKLFYYSFIRVWYNVLNKVISDDLLCDLSVVHLYLLANCVICHSTRDIPSLVATLTASNKTKSIPYWPNHSTSVSFTTLEVLVSRNNHTCECDLFIIVLGPSFKVSYELDIQWKLFYGVSKS